jgi:hypothetical protein
MTIVLPATLATAAACAFINIWLALRVGQVRRVHRVSVGDGGNLSVIARMRAHANFVEYAPFVLVLMALIELAKGPSLWGWGVGALFVVGRVAHGLGMDSWKPGRSIGVAITMLVLAALGIYGAITAYDVAPRPAEAVPMEGAPAA